MDIKKIALMSGGVAWSSTGIGQTIGILAAAICLIKGIYHLSIKKYYESISKNGSKTLFNSKMNHYISSEKCFNLAYYFCVAAIPIIGGAIVANKYIKSMERQRFGKC